MGESTDRPIFSERLETLAIEIYRGREPNAGRFCGNCYNPLIGNDAVCPHCGEELSSVGVVGKVPIDVLRIIRAKHGREARPVRTIAYGGLLLVMILACAGLLFISGNWGIAAFVLILIGGYFLSALLANSVGDELGYRAGQRGLEEQWEAFVAQRSAEPEAAVAERG